MNWETIEITLDDIVSLQHKKMLKCGQAIIPHLTTDDILQPNDFLELELHPLFRYEEGVLAGIQTVQMALRALQKDDEAHAKKS